MGVGMSCDVPSNENMESQKGGSNSEEPNAAEVCGGASTIVRTDSNRDHDTSSCDNEYPNLHNTPSNSRDEYPIEICESRQDNITNVPSLWHYPDMGMYGSTSDSMYGSTTCRVKVQVEVECTSSQKNGSKKCPRTSSLKKPRHKLKLVKEKKKRQPWSFKLNCKKSSKCVPESELPTTSCACNFCPNFRQDPEYRQRELQSFEDFQSCSNSDNLPVDNSTLISNEGEVRPFSRYPSDRFTLNYNPVIDLQLVFEKSLNLGHPRWGTFWTRELSYNPWGIHTQVDYMHYLVPDLLDITNCGFYWGKMDRYEAEKLLNNKPEGTFILRDSAQDDFLFTVSFRRYERSLHARIEQWNHLFTFDARDPSVYQSNTVCGLLEHYKDPSCCMFFEPSLTNPLLRTFPFPLQHLCRATICSKVSYDGIKKLNLPKSLQNYLKEYHYKQRVSVRHWD